MKRAIIPLILLFISSFLFMSMSSNGCNATQGVYQSDVQLKLSKEGWTAEQINIKKRAELASNPDKIWWIYCLADNGQVVYFGPVKGKVTSSQRYISGIDSSGVDVGGDSNPYVYWFDPAGQYFQWDGKYFLTSAEIRIATPVLNFRDVK